MLYNASNFNPTQNTGRIRVAWKDVNWVFGSDNLSNNADVGLPIGAISLLGGSAGVGKTRACVSLLKDTVINLNAKILFFQLEMPIAQFYNKYIGKSPLPCNSNKFFYMSDSFKISEQIKEIDQIKPNIIVIDSVNKIEGFNNGFGTDTIRDYLSAKAVQHNAHVILLAHLNGQGNIKGGTNLPHMGDIVITMTKAKNSKDHYLSLLPNSILFQVDKTRFGPSDRMAILQHRNTGVVCISANCTNPNNDENIIIVKNSPMPISKAIKQAQEAKNNGQQFITNDQLEDKLEQDMRDMIDNEEINIDNRNFLEKTAAKFLGLK